MNMEGYWSGAVKRAGAEVEATARAIKQMPSAESLVGRCGKAVGWQRLLYRMRLLSVLEGEARKNCQPLRRAFLQKIGLPLGAEAAAADSFVWLAEQDELAAERVLMLMRLLGGGGVPARAVGGAVREQQRHVGCGEPVLETKHMRCKCANEEWASCSGCTEAKQGSTCTGKKRCESTCGWNVGGMALGWECSIGTSATAAAVLRERDRILIDLVEADEVEMVRGGCRAAKVWRVSELRRLGGAGLREAVEPGGALERLVGK